MGTTLPGEEVIMVVVVVVVETSLEVVEVEVGNMANYLFFLLNVVSEVGRR
jgi:hypothetical protein